MIKSKTINIIGLGYVGLATALFLNKKGHAIYGWDIDTERQSGLKNNRLPYNDTEFVKAFSEMRNTDNAIHFVGSNEFKEPNFWIIAVGTPLNKNNDFDLAPVFNAVEMVTSYAVKNNHRTCNVIVRSTMPPGTTRRLKEQAQKKLSNVNLDLNVIACPEFSREGSAIADMYNPPLFLVGAFEQNHLVKEVSALFEASEAEVQYLTPEETEMVKCVSNTYHALKVVFANEVATLCSSVGVDGHNVMSAFCQDTKLNISSKYLKPGFAFGGPCLPKDVSGLTALANKTSLQLPLLKSINSSNAQHIYHVKDAILAGCNDDQKIFLYGINFKQGSSDVRGSPTIELLRLLVQNDSKVSIVLTQAEAAGLPTDLQNRVEKVVSFAQGLMQGALLVVGSVKLTATQWDEVRLSNSKMMSLENMFKHFQSTKLSEIVDFKSTPKAAIAP